MLFKARWVPVFFSSFVFLLAGCEERKDVTFGETSFELVVPAPGSKVTDTSTGKMKVEYSGEVNLSNMLLELNGTEITDKFSMSSTSERTVVPLVDLNNVLIQGENTLIAGQMQLDGNGDPVLDVNGRPVLVYSQTFHFYLDNIPPRITVTSVVPVIANLDGSPQAGTTISVEGDLVDVSLITNLSFSFPGGSQSLTETTNDPVGVNQYNNTTKRFNVSLANYPDVDVATTLPHFSYTIADEFEHVRTERFMASGTLIAKQKALQVNNSFGLNFNPLANELIAQAFTRVELYNVLELGYPKYDNPADGLDSANPNNSPLVTREPVPGENMKNPRQGTCVFPSPDVPDVEECRPSAYPGVRVFIYPADSTTCSSLLFQQSAGVTDCIVFIKDIDMTTPAADIEFSENNGLMMGLSLWFNSLSVDVEVVGARNEYDGNIFLGIPDSYTYLGGMKGTIALQRFSVETDFRLSPQSNTLLQIERVTPLHLELTDLLKVPKVTGDCAICSPLISPFSMIALALGTDLNSNGTTDKEELINMIGSAVENKIGSVFDDVAAGLVTSSAKLIQNAPVNDKQMISTSAVVNAYTVYNNNAHFAFDGHDRVDPAFYTPAYSTVNGGLGSLFATQGAYYTNLVPGIKGWGITSGGQKIIDMSFAVSANSVNQWLLANHQTGLLDEFELTLTGADFATVDIAVDPTDELSLTINTNEAPTVKFNSVDTSSISFCNGTELCLNPNGASPASVVLKVNALDLHLDNITDTTVLVDANMNIEMEVEIYVAAGLPVFKLKDNSLRVEVNNVVQPTVVTNAMMASLIADGIESLMNSSTLRNLVEQPLAAMLSSLPGAVVDPLDPSIVVMDLSNVPSTNCASPSPTGRLCLNGNPILYSQLLQGVVPRDYALLFRWLTVEKGGSYLSIGLDVRNKAAGTWTLQELDENFVTLQITP